MSNPIIRAIDVGYGNTKYVESIVFNKPICSSFPSIAPLAVQSNFGKYELKKRNTIKVDLDGKEYEVGPDAELFMNDVPVLTEDYIFTPQYLALLRGGLASMDTNTIDLLITGLPVEYMQLQATQLRELIIGKHVINKELTVEVRDAAVVPQPLGGFVSYCQQNKVWEYARGQTNLLIDPGYYTIDWMVATGMKEIPERCGSHTCGISTFLKSIAKHVSKETKHNHLDLRRIDRGLRKGSINIFGKPLDLRPFAKKAEATLTPAIKALKNCIQSEQDIDAIYLVGGGATIFFNTICTAFPHHVIHIVDDPIFANVRGFQIIGEQIFTKKLAA